MGARERATLRIVCRPFGILNLSIIEFFLLKFRGIDRQTGLARHLRLDALAEGRSRFDA